jgi:two-component system, cell cycle sensor histidine kinase and response regulator CckA
MSAVPPSDVEFELARLAAIVESSADAVIGKTLEGVITSWNAGAVRMYGYAADEVVGRNVSLLFPPGRAAELGPILSRLRQGERVEFFDTQRVRKDGSVIDVAFSASPIRDAVGVVVGGSAVVRDLTEIRRAEANRHSAEETVLLETVGDLAGGIAHHFNNLLAAIVGYAGFVAEATTDRPAVQADVEQVVAAAARAAALARQLLIFSRRDPADPELLDLGTVVADLRGTLSSILGPEVKLRIEPAARVALTVADRGQVEQVLTELANNARDAMPGGGTLTIGAGVTVLGDGDALPHSGVDAGRYAELIVADTGTGMTPEVAGHAFEPFFTTKPPGWGTGLGLSTVWGVATRAGGGVGVESGKSAGTTLRVWFPAASTPAPAAAAPTAAVPALEGHGEIILVVDDEPALLAIVSRILQRRGYVTVEAGSGQEALSLAASHDFQLLLTDSVMPGMSGEVLAGRVGVLKPGLPVLQMSGYSSARSATGGGSGGEGELFVRKPFTPEGLLAKVRAALDGAAGA